MNRFRSDTQSTLLDDNSSSNGGHQAMLVKTSKVQLPSVQRASRVQLEAVGMKNNGFDSVSMGHDSTNGEAALNLRRLNGSCDIFDDRLPRRNSSTSSSATVANRANLVNQTPNSDVDTRFRMVTSRNPLTVLEGSAKFATDSFMKYCQETSLHGWKYVQATNTLERVGWLILLIVALTTASVLVYRAVNDFLAHTVSTNMDSLSTTYDNLYFPAITVCNMNFMQRSVLQKYNVQHNDTLIEIFDRMINTGSKQNFTDEEMQMFNDIERMTNGSARLKMEGQPKCHNMFLQYYWKNQDIPFNNGQTTMHYGQTTDESVCCQIFPGMLPDENHVQFDVTNLTFWLKEPNPWQIVFDGYKKGIKPGKQGVEVLIDVETYEYFSVHSSGSEGVLVLIQHYRDIPLMRKESFVLAPGHEADVGLSITEIITSDSAIERFTPEERDCYVHDEVNLKSLPLKKGYRMSMKNCLFDKALQATKAICGCKPPFYVLGALGNITTCQGTQLDCAYKIFDDPNHYKVNGTEQKCLAPCNDQIYDSRITLATYPNRAMFSKRPEICSLVRKLLKICQGWVDPHAVGAYGQYGDELKIKKRVLTNMYPEICDMFTGIFGDDPMATANVSCADIRRELAIANNSREIFELLHKYAKENLLWLNVYVKDSFATRIIRDERMTRTSFVANVGGLLGLCMGFSLVSVAEILYFCLKRNACAKSPKEFDGSNLTGSNTTHKDVTSISLETVPNGTGSAVTVAVHEAAVGESNVNNEEPKFYQDC